MKKFIKSIFLLLCITFTVVMYSSLMQIGIPSIQGHWIGSLDNGVTKLTFSLDVVQDSVGHILCAEIDIPEERTEEKIIGTVVDEITLQDNMLKFDVKHPQMSYVGSINKEETEISGTLCRVGQFAPLILKRVSLKRNAPDQSSLQSQMPDCVPSKRRCKFGGIGNPSFWTGAFDVRVMELTVTLGFVSMDATGKLRATVSISELGMYNAPVDTITLQDNTLKFGVKHPRVGQVSYEGFLNDEETEISGTLKLEGKTFPLVLKYVMYESGETPETLKRSQRVGCTDKYHETEVKYENKAGRVMLSGTLTIPRGTETFPAVILISGSGQHARDYCGLEHEFFRVFADHLARQRIAVLRFDKRGCCGSTGDFEIATVQDFASDVQAGIEYLKSRPEINTKHIGLIGHSEGATVASMVAAESPDANFLVMLGGPGVNLEALSYVQRSLIGRAIGETEETIAMGCELLSQIYIIVKKEADVKVAKERICAVHTEYLAKLPKAKRKAVEDSFPANQVFETIKYYPWLRFAITFEPASVLKKVKVPVLALFGELDLRVPPAQNLLPVSRALEESGNSDHTVLVLPKLNHQFQHCKTGSPRENAKIEETIAPEILEMISKWILERTGKR